MEDAANAEDIAAAAAAVDGSVSGKVSHLFIIINRPGSRACLSVCVWGTMGRSGGWMDAPTYIHPHNKTQPQQTTTYTQDTAAGAAGAATGAGAATANPLAAARKLSASKHLLVRNDSYNEMRREQQAEMAAQMVSVPEASAPPAVAVAPVPSVPPAVAPAAGGKDEEQAAASGAPMPAAS